jgi:hypothetical protein
MEAGHRGDTIMKLLLPLAALCGSLAMLLVGGADRVLNYL